MIRTGAILRQSLKLAGTLLALAGGTVFAAQPADAPHALIENYCAGCHNATDWAGSLAFDTLELGHVTQDAKVWEKTVDKLRGRLMPPAGEKQPSQAEVDSVVAWLEGSLDSGAKAQPIGHDAFG